LNLGQQEEAADASLEQQKEAAKAKLKPKE
jgi:hypothetical protein